MESASSRPVLTSLASIAFSLAVVFLFLAVRGIWPFGGRFLEYMDNGQLVYPTLKYYASALMSGAFDGAFFYDVNGGAGIRVSPTLPHQLLIPSTWIAVAMGDSFLLKDMVWVMLADVACICVTASWFLRRVFPSLPVCWTVLLTAGYAVGGFFQTKYGFMQFLDHAAMFPLFALGAGTPRAPGPRVLVHGGGNAGHLLLLAADGGNEPGFHAFPVYDAAHVF